MLSKILHQSVLLALLVATPHITSGLPIHLKNTGSRNTVPRSLARNASPFSGEQVNSAPLDSVVKSVPDTIEKRQSEANEEYYRYLKASEAAKSKLNVHEKGKRAAQAPANPNTQNTPNANPQAIPTSAQGAGVPEVPAQRFTDVQLPQQSPGASNGQQSQGQPASDGKQQTDQEVSGGQQSQSNLKPATSPVPTPQTGNNNSNDTKEVSNEKESTTTDEKVVAVRPVPVDDDEDDELEHETVIADEDEDSDLYDDGYGYSDEYYDCDYDNSGCSGDRVHIVHSVRPIVPVGPGPLVPVGAPIIHPAGPIIPVGPPIIRPVGSVSGPIVGPISGPIAGPIIPVSHPGVSNVAVGGSSITVTANSPRDSPECKDKKGTPN